MRRMTRKTETNMEKELEQLELSVISGKRKDAAAITASLLGVAAPGRILESLIGAMDNIGRRFKANEIFVPEVLIAARAMKASMEILEPELVAAGIAPDSSIVIGTVEGDLHDIGKNLVAMMLKGANFKVVDLGVNVSAQAFADAVADNDADVLCLSSLLTTTMDYMKVVIDEVRKRGLPVKIMVGGAPITQEYADEIGADGYSADASSAVELAKKLVA